MDAPDSPAYPELTGNELTVEFHLFKFTKSDIPAVIRWRLNEQPKS